MDYAAHYLLHMDEWPFEMLESLDSELGSTSLALFEMVHSRWNDASYLQVIDQYGGRPVIGNHATLLYANA